MDLQFTPFEVQDFTGGQTDEYNSAGNTQYYRADNLVLLPNGDFRSRPGSQVVNSTWVSNTTRISALAPFNDATVTPSDGALLLVANTSLFALSGLISAPVNQPVNTPNNTAAFTAGDANSYPMAEMWRKHILFTNNSGCTPLKVYKSDANNFAVLPIGLIRFPDNRDSISKTARINEAIVLANDIKAKMNTHITSLTAHPSAQTAVATADATDEASLVALTKALLVAWRTHISDARSLGSAVFHNITHQTQSFGHFYARVSAAPIDIWTCIPTLNELKRVVNFHLNSFVIPESGVNDAVDSMLHTGGAPSLVSAANVVIDIYPGPVNFTGLAANPLYTYFEETRAAYNAHQADVAGAGGHSGTDATVIDGTPITSDHTLVLGYYRLLFAYRKHRTLNGVIHAGAESNTTDCNTADLLGSTVADTPSYAPDPTQLTDLQVLLAGLADLVTVIKLHVADGARHLAVGAWSDYLPNGGNYTYTLSTPVEYLYALVYRNSYTNSDGVEFVDQSRPYIFSSGVVFPSVQQWNTGLSVYGKVTTPVTFYNLIPAMAATGLNPAPTVSRELYRTTANGTTLYKIDELDNTNSGAYSDYALDTDIVDYEQIYTTGGIVANDPPPQARFLHVCDDYTYYGYITDEYGVTYPNRIMQAVQNAPGACPGSFFVDLPDPVTGISSSKGVRIAWTAKKTYRLDGTFDETGQGSISHTVISDSVGMTASYSPVQVDGGVVFFGSDGVYFTDGYQVRKLSKDWRTTYLTLLNNPLLIRGVYHRQKNQVWWGVATSGTENNACVILDMNFPLSENSVFTTASNGTSFNPTSLAYYRNQIIRGDAFSSIFYHDDSYLTDPKINTAIAKNTWQLLTIRYDLRTPAYNFGTSLSRKWITEIDVKARNKGNLSLQINSINNDAQVISQLTAIRFRGATLTSGNLSIVTDVGGPTYPNRGTIEETRKFPAGSLRCDSKQLQFTNAKVVIANSDTSSLGTVVHAAKTVTIASGTWPANLSDHTIAFVGDGYVQEFTILSQTTTVLTVSDAGGLLPADGSYKWEIRGYPKDEVFQLISFNMPVAYLGQKHQDGTESTGANA